MRSRFRVEELKDEDRKEGKAERDAEWIEWALNGGDLNKMLSVVNPVESATEPEPKPASNDK